jgi:hypothetical protein
VRASGFAWASGAAIGSRQREPSPAATPCQRLTSRAGRPCRRAAARSARP